MNCIDLYSSEPTMRSNLGRALEGRRDQLERALHVLRTLCTMSKGHQCGRCDEVSESDGRTGRTAGDSPGTLCGSGTQSR